MERTAIKAVFFINIFTYIMIKIERGVYE